MKKGGATGAPRPSSAWDSARLASLQSMPNGVLLREMRSTISANTKPPTAMSKRRDMPEGLGRTLMNYHPAYTLFSYTRFVAGGGDGNGFSKDDSRPNGNSFRFHKFS